MTAAIERRLELDADIDDVWRALTDPTELSGWFGDSASLDLKVGGDGWLGWEKHGRFSVRVEVFEPPHRFSWRWSKDADTPIEDGPSTLVEWKLTARDGGGTLLELRESGFAETKHRQDNEGGWTAELRELVEFLGRRKGAAATAAAIRSMTKSPVTTDLGALIREDRDR